MSDRGNRGRRGWLRGLRVVSLALVVTVGGTAAFWPGSARAQSGSAVAPITDNPYYAAPGHYGTSWGTASFGTVRTYSEFSSSYGAGYAYGYPPATLLPGPYGVGLWRNGATTSPYVHGGPNQYRTFAVPFGKTAGSALPPAPPFGVYAPAFGPSFPGR